MRGSLAGMQLRSSDFQKQGINKKPSLAVARDGFFIVAIRIKRSADLTQNDVDHLTDVLHAEDFLHLKLHTKFAFHLVDHGQMGERIPLFYIFCSSLSVSYTHLDVYKRQRL